jgi:succinate dehydrogenase / fumarate reductase cytochrome b subunit
MTWFVKYLATSIGKKQAMAVSGLLLCGFLVSHLSGNFLLFAGREAFNEYADTLKSFGPLFYVAEVLLAAVFLIHIGLAVKLTAENRRARPVAYAVDGNRGASTKASAHMFVSGGLILVFLLIHLWSFRLADLSETTLYDVVMTKFQNPLYVLYYVFSSSVVGFHVWHGFQSAFKSLGFDHPKYTPCLERLGKLFAVGMGAGYSSLPVWACFLSGYGS